MAFIYVCRFAADAEAAIDQIRRALRPARRPAHLSICGPFSDTLDAAAVGTLQAIVGAQVHCTAFGDFFSDGQGTLYLACDPFEILQQVWNKPGRPFTPHVTLYDDDLSQALVSLRARLAGLEPLRVSLPIVAVEEWEVGQRDPTVAPLAPTPGDDPMDGDGRFDAIRSVMLRMGWVTK